MVSPPAWTSSAGILSTPVDFPFSQWCYCQSQLPHGQQSSTALSLQLSWLYSSEQYSVHLLRISCSSVRHFPDLSWIVEDLPCFSKVRSFTSWYALLLLLLFRQVSVSSHWAPILSFFAFFTAFWILLFASLYSIAPSASYRFFFKSLLSSQRSRTSLVTHGFFLRRSFLSISLAASITSVL